MKEGEKYCDVCKAELKIDPLIRFAVLEDDQEQVLCPICKRNYMDVGEAMCAECREEANDKAMIEPDTDIDSDDDESWREYLDEDEKEAISNKADDEEMLSLAQLEEEEAKKFFDDEEEDDDEEYYDGAPSDEDDFDYPDAPEEDFEDYEEDEEEEGDDEEEDEEGDEQV